MLTFTQQFFDLPDISAHILATIGVRTQTEAFVPIAASPAAISVAHRGIGEVDLEASESTVQARTRVLKASDQGDPLPDVLPSHRGNDAGHPHIQVRDEDSALMSPCAAATEAHSSRELLCDVQSEHQQGELDLSGLLEKERSSSSSSCLVTGRSHSLAATTTLDVHHCILELILTG